jgi:hypothetical protein
MTQKKGLSIRQKFNPKVVLTPGPTDYNAKKPLKKAAVVPFT